MGLVNSEVGGVTNDFGVTLVGNKVAFGVGNPDRTIFSTSIVNTGNWVHVAATRNKATGQMQLYINGNLESTTTANTNSLTVPNYILLGRDISGAMYRGNLDEVRIWNTVRSATEISSNMNTTISGTPTGLVNYYKFDQGTANGTNSTVTTLTDSVGTNNSALLNFALTGTTSNWVLGANSSGNGMTFNNGSGNVTGIVVPASLPAGTYSGTLNTINSTTGCTGSLPITFTVTGTVITSPTAASSQSVCTGATPTPLTVVATGTGLTYQWYSNVNNSNTGGVSLGAANGAQTATYTPLTNVQGTTYYYLVINSGCAVTSPVFQVNVGNSLDNIGAGSSAPNAAVAYSFRSLSTCYSGPLGRFRIGTNYYDVYGDTANGVLSLDSPISAATTNASAAIQPASGSLLSSVVNSTTTAYVSIWYDQSGNGKNLVQTNTSMQPQIITAGVIERENGRPFIKWYYKSSLNLAADLTTNGQVFVVNKFGTPSNADGFLLGHTNTYYWHAYPTIYGNDKLFTTNGWTSGPIINGTVWQNGTFLQVNIYFDR